MATEVAATPNADTTVVTPAAAPAAAVVAPAADDAAAVAAAAAAKPVEPAAPAKAEADAKPAVGAPEKYADFTVPEGVTLDPELLGEFSAAAKELGLSQENAQKLVAMGAKITQKNAGEVEATVEKAKAEWAEQSKTDKEFGGDKFEANLADARTTFQTFGTPELGKLLEDSGLDRHPEMLRWALKVSKAISPDKLAHGRQSAAPAVSWYDHPTSQSK
jgi:hypothetical protein